MKRLWKIQILDATTNCILNGAINSKHYYVDGESCSCGAYSSQQIKDSKSEHLFCEIKAESYYKNISQY